MPVGEPNGLNRPGVGRDLPVGAHGYRRLVQPGALQSRTTPQRCRNRGCDGGGDTKRGAGGDDVSLRGAPAWPMALRGRASGSGGGGGGGDSGESTEPIHDPANGAGGE